MEYTGASKCNCKCPCNKRGREGLTHTQKKRYEDRAERDLKILALKITVI